MKLLKFAVLGLFLLAIACDKDSPTDPAPVVLNNTNEYDQSTLVENPIAFELFNVGIALTDFADENTYYVDKNTAYYNEVMTSFGPFENHVFIQTMEYFVGLNLSQGNSQLFDYNNLKAASLLMELSGDTLAMDESALTSVPDSIVAMFAPIVGAANLFMHDTNFLQFYQNHTGVYEQYIADFKLAIPAKSAWNWLERQFNISYSTYFIPLTPLTGGSHFTIRDQSFGNTIIMVTSGPDQAITTKIEEGNYTRFLFTEIDHNYVNPVSDTHLDLINTAFADVNKWNTQEFYRTPYTTFNEYMTWATYSLFAYDRYNEADFLQVNQAGVDNMVNNRRFIKFEAFNNELLRLYKNREAGVTVEELFVPMLNWAAGQ